MFNSSDAPLIFIHTDAKIFHLLEDWVRPERSEDENQPVGTTMYLKRMYNFQRYMMLNSYCLAGGNEQAGLQIMGSQGLADQSASKSKTSVGLISILTSIPISHHMLFCYLRGTRF
jgi:hypothetical protein